MAFFVGCILQQCLNLKQKKDNQIAATSGSYNTVFFKTRQHNLTTPAFNSTNKRKSRH
jgi:hypothetical protein